MTRALTLIAAGLILSVTTSQAATTCLRASQIRSTDSPDGKSLLITMKDGKVWDGELVRGCSGIKFSGFVWKVSADQVCENQQLLRVPTTGALCALGKLTLKSAPVRARN